MKLQTLPNQLPYLWCTSQANTEHAHADAHVKSQSTTVIATTIYLSLVSRYIVILLCVSMVGCAAAKSLALRAARTRSSFWSSGRHNYCMYHSYQRRRQERYKNARADSNTYGGLLVGACAIVGGVVSAILMARV